MASNMLKSLDVDTVEFAPMVSADTPLVANDISFVAEA